MLKKTYFLKLREINFSIITNNIDFNKIVEMSYLQHVSTLTFLIEETLQCHDLRFTVKLMTNHPLAISTNIIKRNPLLEENQDR